MTTTPEQPTVISPSFTNHMETIRRNHEIAMDNKRTRMELIRMAKETLIENARNKPASEAIVTAEEITEFANKLSNYVGE